MALKGDLERAGDGPVDGAVAMERELELKLRIPSDEVSGVSRLPAVRHALVAQPRTHRLVTIYFDTPDRALARHGMALRIRQAGRKRVQTLKVAVESSGETLKHHEEWSAPVQDDVPDIGRLGQAGARLARLGVEGALAEVFRTEIKRRTFPLEVGAARIELALDIGAIKTAELAEPISEIELELKAGDAGAVFELAEHLVLALPLHVEHRTKAGRGYALVDASVPRPLMAEAATLEADWGPWRAFTVVARACLSQLYGNEIAILEGANGESVHQLRVAVRRLRAAFSSFGALLQGEPAISLRRELRWLQRTMGPARDWDVFLSETIEPLRHAMPRHVGLRHLAELAEAARARAYEAARLTLASQRYALIQIRLEQWLGGEGPDAGGNALPDFAARAIAKRDRKLRKVAAIAGASDERMHEVRIAAKKLRYAAEFFPDLFERRKVKRFIKPLRRMQDCLGALNDAAVARRLLMELDGVDRETMAVLDGWLAARVTDGKSHFEGLWDDFEDEPRYWED